jgi:hypothetical protein
MSSTCGEGMENEVGHPVSCCDEVKVRAALPSCPLHALICMLLRHRTTVAFKARSRAQVHPVFSSVSSSKSSMYRDTVISLVLKLHLRTEVVVTCWMVGPVPHLRDDRRIWSFCGMVTDRGKLEFLERNLSQCHSIHHKSNME